MFNSISQKLIRSWNANEFTSSLKIIDTAVKYAERMRRVMPVLLYCLATSLSAQIVDSIVVKGSVLNAMGLLESRNKLYLSNNSDESIIVVDGSTDSIIKTIEGVGDDVFALAVSEHHAKIYTGSCWEDGDPEKSLLTIIDATVDTIIRQFSLRIISRDIAFAEDTVLGKIYFYYGAQTPGLGYIGVIDGETDSITDSIVQCWNHHMDLFVVNSKTSTVYFPQSDSNVLIIDGSTYAVRRYDYPDKYCHALHGCLVNETDNKIYIPFIINRNEFVGIYDADSDTLRLTEQNLTWPMAYNDRSNTIFCSGGTFNTNAAFIDGATDKVSYLDSGGGYEFGVRKQTNRFYAATYEDIIITDGTEQRVVKVLPGVYTIPLTAARNMSRSCLIAINQKSGKVYISNFPIDGKVRILQDYPTPGKPTLCSPPNSEAAQPVTLSLSWDTVSDASTYHIQLATDSSFTSESSIVDDSTLTSTVKNVGSLTTNTTYYWRVNAKNAGGTGAWSKVRSFTTNLSSSATIPIKSDVSLNGTTGNSASIRYFIPSASNVRIQLISLQGRLLKTILDAHLEPGFYHIPLGISSFSKGYYLLNFTAGEKNVIKRISNF